MNTIIFEYDNVSASENLETYARQKLDILFERYDFLVRASMFFKTENTTSDETGMITGIRLSAPGPRLFAEASHDNFRASINECISELQKQLSKRSEKMKTY